MDNQTIVEKIETYLKQQKEQFGNTLFIEKYSDALPLFQEKTNKELISENKMKAESKRIVIADEPSDLFP